MDRALGWGQESWILIQPLNQITLVVSQLLRFWESAMIIPSCPLYPRDIPGAGAEITENSVSL